MRRALVLFLTVFAVVVFVRYLSAPADRPLVDFKAFYCASRAMEMRLDPYRYASVAPCERAPGPSGTFVAGAENVIPAPVPGYVFVFFAPLAALRYPIAAAIDLGLECACTIGAVVLLRRAIALPTALIATTVMPLGFAADAVTGQIATFALFGVSLAAAARGRRWRTLGIAIAMLQPNVGIASALAVAIFDRRMRWPLGGVALGLATVSIVALGPATTAQYVVETLPQAAHNATIDPTEFGAMWFLATFGLPIPAAVAIGSSTTLLGIAAGVAIGGALARRFDDPAALVTVPPCLAITGAGYVHESQYVLAIPAALTLAASRTGLTRHAPIVLAFLIGIPWAQANVNDALIPAIACIAAIAAVSVRAPTFVVHAAWIGTFGASLYLGTLNPRARFGPVIARAADPLIATETTWGRLEARETIDRIGDLASLKAPTTIGTFGISSTALLLAYRPKKRQSPSASD